MDKENIVNKVLRTPGPDPGPIAKLWQGIEGVYDAFGLMGGESTAPAKRFIFTGGVAYAIVYFVKPKFAFSGDKLRSWLLTSPEDQDATTLPAWMVALAAAGFGGLFV